jgi:hypothetical protein
VALSVTVQRLVAPTVRVGGQARAWIVGGGGWTSTAAVALLPLRLAVTVAVPRFNPVTGKEAESVWAGTVMRSPGRPTMVGSLVVRKTSVLVGWLAFRVTVRVPLLPSVRGRTGGRRLTTVGRGMTTVTWLSAVLPLRVAVIVAVPGPTPKTANVCEVCPAGTVTVPEGGRLTMLALLEVRAISVSVAWAALMVTVRVPEAPWVT